MPGDVYRWHPVWLGLAFGGDPFKDSLANDVIYLLGRPPVLSVHVLFAIATLGVYRYLKLPANDDQPQVSRL